MQHSVLQCDYVCVHSECHRTHARIVLACVLVSSSLLSVLSQVLFLSCSLSLSVSPFKAQDSADLVFLIDGSQNVGAANFPFVRDMVARIIERLDVGRDTVRVALALYHSDPEIKFYLNSHDSRSSVLDAVRRLAFPAGDQSNLGAALEEVEQSLLSESSGGRAEEGVPQMVVVISGGPSADDTVAGDRALKRAGVVTFVVAVGGAPTAELQAVATDPTFVLSNADFRSLANTGDQLLPYITGVAQRIIIVETEVTEGM